MQKNKLILQTLENLQKQKEKKNSWNITWELGVILSQFISIKKAQEILEIGTSNGFSTLFMAKELEKNSNITTIEIDETRFNEAKNNFSKAGVLDKINQLNGDALDILENYPFEHKFDFVFVDALQKQYIDIIKKLEEKDFLQKNAILIFDNVDSHKHMTSFVENIPNNYTSRKIDIGSGFLVLHKKD